MMARVATLSSTLRLQSIGDHPTGAQNGQTTNRIFSVPLGADEESVAKNISNRWRPRIVNPRDKGLRLLLNGNGFEVFSLQHLQVLIVPFPVLVPTSASHLWCLQLRRLHQSTPLAIVGSILVDPLESGCILFHLLHFQCVDSALEKFDWKFVCE